MAIAFAVSIAAPFIGAARIWSDGWEPTGDVATIGLRARDAWTADAPLVGQPTTGDSYASVPSHHPGPIEYWIMGPFVRLLGPRGGVLGASAAINSAALFGSLLLCLRRGGPLPFALLSVGLACLVWALGAASLADAMNSELTVYPMVLTVIAAWAVVERDPLGLPIFIPAASVSAQLHVAAAAFVAGPVIVVAVVCAMQRRQGIPRGAAVAGLVVAAACWLPVAIHEATEPSNVVALWRTISAPHTRVGLAFSLDRLIGAVAPVPLFARRSGATGFVHEVASPLLAGGALILGIWGSVLLRTRLVRGPRRHVSFGALVLITVVIAAVGWAGIPPLAAFRPDGARWLWVGTTLVWVSFAWSVAAHAPRRWQPAIRAWVVPVGAAVALGVLGAALLQPGVAERRDGEAMAATRSVAEQVQSHVQRGTYRVVLDGSLAGLTVGPGVVYLLESEGYRITFDDESATAAFGAQRATEGQSVDGTLTMTTAETGGEGSEVAVANVRRGSSRASVRVLLS